MKPSVSSLQKETELPTEGGVGQGMGVTSSILGEG